jgi:hypothetical protein
MRYVYHAHVLKTLEGHGLRPTVSTPPELVKDHLTNLYLYELRGLRKRLMRKEFPKHEYATLVESLRQRYTLMSLASNRWTTESG